MIENNNVITLSRGGYLVETSNGLVQFGAPPETIKDTMLLPGNVPEIFVLTRDMFSWKKGIGTGEMEFPLYYNFFIRNKKTTIICTPENFERMKIVLHESLFGPDNMNLEIDYDLHQGSTYIPDIKREMNYFRNNRKLSDLVQFGLFHDNHFSFHGLTINIKPNGDFELIDKGTLLAEIPGKIDYKPQYQIGARLPEPYHPPLFGITCLGPSHGFDPTENTSGFIIWLNHQGVMVDPPVNSTEWLEDSNVNPKAIDSIILTHCHADHDAGTFQKILEEGKITLYTTETILASFVRKYSALSNVESADLRKLFNFQPIKIGLPNYINGGIFKFYYTLHSIPTIGFKMEFQDQSFVYTSDHNNDPSVHKRLFDEGVISQERYDEFKNFPWDTKVIYHEAGIPPLHTPIEYLNSLPEELKKKIVIYHIAKKNVPENTGLTLAKFGIEHTLSFNTRVPKFEEAYQILSILKCVDFFQDMPISKSQEFLDIVEEERYSKGDLIISKGSNGDKFYIIYSGNISVDSGGLNDDKIYGAYDYFGEVALITDQPRAADVIAATDVVLYTISRDKFLNFISGTDFELTLRRLVKIRSSETWNLLSENEAFKRCTASQKTWLESLFIPAEKNDSGVLLKQGEEIKYIYIIREGLVKVLHNEKMVGELHRGDFVGSFQRLYKNLPAKYTFTYDSPVKLYAMEASQLYRFIEKNPGLMMKLVYEF